MPTVIDRITLNKRWTHRYPQWAKYGEGLMVLLNPEQIDSSHDLAGRTAHITRPDGVAKSLQIHHSEVHNGVVGLFFEGVDESMIPRLSVVTWESK